MFISTLSRPLDILDILYKRTRQCPNSLMVVPSLCASYINRWLVEGGKKNIQVTWGFSWSRISINHDMVMLTFLLKKFQHLTVKSVWLMKTRCQGKPQVTSMCKSDFIRLLQVAISSNSFESISKHKQYSKSLIYDPFYTEHQQLEKSKKRW